MPDQDARQAGQMAVREKKGMTLAQFVHLPPAERERMGRQIIDRACELQATKEKRNDQTNE